jgi:hypothetical protein
MAGSSGLTAAPGRAVATVRCIRRPTTGGDGKLAHAADGSHAAPIEAVTRRAAQPEPGSKPGLQSMSARRAGMIALTGPVRHFGADEIRWLRTCQVLRIRLTCSQQSVRIVVRRPECPYRQHLTAQGRQRAYSQFSGRTVGGTSTAGPRHHERRGRRHATIPPTVAVRLAGGADEPVRPNRKSARWSRVLAETFTVAAAVFTHLVAVRARLTADAGNPTVGTQAVDVSPHPGPRSTAIIATTAGRAA